LARSTELEDLEEPFTLASGRRVLIRPIRPEDEPEHYDFLSKLSPEDIRLRFFASVGSMPHEVMQRFTDIDYRREMAFVATADRGDGGNETLGVARTVEDDEGGSAEFAVIVRTDIKHQGLGRKLMAKSIAYSRQKGVRRLIGLVLWENRPMLDMLREMGFSLRTVPEEGAVEATLLL
jgi:acetyltransferase